MSNYKAFPVVHSSNATISNLQSVTFYLSSRHCHVFRRSCPTIHKKACLRHVSLVGRPSHSLKIFEEACAMFYVTPASKHSLFASRSPLRLILIKKLQKQKITDKSRFQHKWHINLRFLGKNSLKLDQKLSIVT